MDLIRKSPLQGFIIGDSMRLGMLVALASASDVTPKKLAETFVDDEKLQKYVRSFMAELIREGANQLESVQDKSR